MTHPAGPLLYGDLFDRVSHMGAGSFPIVPTIVLAAKLSEFLPQRMLAANAARSGPLAAPAELHSFGRSGSRAFIEGQYIISAGVLHTTAHAAFRRYEIVLEDETGGILWSWEMALAGAAGSISSVIVPYPLYIRNEEQRLALELETTTVAGEDLISWLNAVLIGQP